MTQFGVAYKYMPVAVLLPVTPTAGLDEAYDALAAMPEEEGFNRVIVTRDGLGPWQETE